MAPELMNGSLKKYCEGGAHLHVTEAMAQACAIPQIPLKMATEDEENKATKDEEGGVDANEDATAQHTHNCDSILCSCGGATTQRDDHFLALHGAVLRSFDCRQIRCWVLVLRFIPELVASQGVLFTCVMHIERRMLAALKRGAGCRHRQSFC